ncbi:MAG: hypothetical protein WAX89_00875 [Alphaproteobacteria bacterium]
MSFDDTTSHDADLRAAIAGMAADIAASDFGQALAGMSDGELADFVRTEGPETSPLAREDLDMLLEASQSLIANGSHLELVQNDLQNLMEQAIIEMAWLEQEAGGDLLALPFTKIAKLAKLKELLEVLNYDKALDAAEFKEDRSGLLAAYQSGETKYYGFNFIHANWEDALADANTQTQTEALIELANIEQHFTAEAVAERGWRQALAGLDEAKERIRAIKAILAGCNYALVHELTSDKATNERQTLAMQAELDRTLDEEL